MQHNERIGNIVLEAAAAAELAAREQIRAGFEDLEISGSFIARAVLDAAEEFTARARRIFLERT